MIRIRNTETRYSLEVRPPAWEAGIVHPDGVLVRWNRVGGQLPARLDVEPHPQDSYNTESLTVCLADSRVLMPHLDQDPNY